MPRTKVVVAQAEFQGFPSRCASCLASQELTMVPVRTRAWFSPHAIFAVPSCANCKTWHPRFRGLLRGLEIVVAVAFGLLVERRYPLSAVVASVTLFALLLPIAGAAERFSAPVFIFKKRKAELLTFSFRNPEFAQEFRVMNSVSAKSADFG